MIPPLEHPNETGRLEELNSYSILDTLPEEDYDNLTEIAAEICGTPISLVSLLDDKRQWFKSHHGLNAESTPKEYAFCAHAIHEDEIFIIQDSRTDNRFHDNPLVTGEPKVIFYAGVPLVTEQGLPLGTLCVIDHTPKLLSKSQIGSLKALAKQVMNLLELRKSNALLETSMASLKEKNEELEQFAYIAAHDLKSPLNNISSISELFSESYGPDMDEEGKMMLSFIKNASDKLKGLVDGLLQYSRSDSVFKEGDSLINLESLKSDILGLYSYDNEISIDLKSNVKEVKTNRAAINQILMNLISNAIKYSDKEHVKIELGIFDIDNNYECYVKDNGPGIPSDQHEKIFEIFITSTEKDKYGNAGNGLGLATVKKIVEKMGGSIKVESSLGKGANFIFRIQK
ncbi:signal transduction histidine kinase [Saonia flava]|uniref:histidine kinase n=1 Tax=Saonia flava TaxID=523696 RepID=A0A846QW58_9FLAO|nr:GAF domain-containing sensor histidine kinase [Saonia flava]NJB70513.1 signal transduction histidine kinase [Saonia flava]